MKIYTDGKYIHHAKPMNNHEFMIKYEDHQDEQLTHLTPEDGYLVKYQDEQIQMTSWYPKAVFENKFTLVE